MSALHDRIIELSKKYKLSHLGSCLTAVDIIDEIYSVKKPDEKFVLSCGHSGLALYVVMEKYQPYDAEELFLKFGVHPERCVDIPCSTGSLGQGLPIALGMAISDKTKDVYCLISDGEASEGTIWEVANVMRKYKVDNLKIYCNWNGWGAYDKTDNVVKLMLQVMIPGMIPGIKMVETSVTDYGFIGQEAHYKTL